MSSDISANDQLLQALVTEAREMTSQSVMFNQAIAERLGVNATDVRCMDILNRLGPITAGQLAEHTGLTTGAITGVVDRLEQAGLVNREPDPDDRRRVIIKPIQTRGIEVGKLFASIARAWQTLCSHYSEQELSLVLDFMTRTRTVLREETAKLRTDASASASGSADTAANPGE